MLLGGFTTVEGRGLLLVRLPGGQASRQAGQPSSELQFTSPASYVTPICFAVPCTSAAAGLYLQQSAAAIGRCLKETSGSSNRQVARDSSNRQVARDQWQQQWAGA